MAIYYIQYEAIPLPESGEFEECGGAYVNCWVEADSEEDASQLASTRIRERGWQIISVEEECREISEEEATEDEENKQCYEQAVAQGECYAFYQWPAEAQEGDDVH
jgi:hypothetical protein